MKLLTREIPSLLGLKLKLVAKRVKETEYLFAIVLKESGKVIGQIDAYPEGGEPHQYENAVRNNFSPCWMLNKAYFGKGYAYEAAHAFFSLPVS